MKSHLTEPKVYSLGVTLSTFVECDVAAGSFFNWLKQIDAQTTTTVEVAANATFQDYYDIVTVFKELEAYKLGDFIVGRKGHESRIEWKYTTESICKLAFDPSFKEDELAPITAKYKGQVPNSNSQKSYEHLFFLRPDFKLELALPVDFNRGDCQRLTKWLDTIPFD